MIEKAPELTAKFKAELEGYLTAKEKAVAAEAELATAQKSYVAAAGDIDKALGVARPVASGSLLHLIWLIILSFFTFASHVAPYLPAIPVWSPHVPAAPVTQKLYAVLISDQTDDASNLKLAPIRRDLRLGAELGALNCDLHIFNSTDPILKDKNYTFTSTELPLLIVLKAGDPKPLVRGPPPPDAAGLVDLIKKIREG